MSKEVKKVYSLIEEKKKMRDQLIIKIEAELKTCNEKLTALNTALEKSESAEQYKSLLQEIRDYEATKEFLEKKLNEARAYLLSSEDCNNIVKAINSSFVELQKEQRDIIVAEIDKLMKLLFAYDSEVAELNKLVTEVNSITKSNVLSLFNPQTLTANDPDKRYFVEAFYKMKIAKEIMKRFN